MSSAPARTVVVTGAARGLGRAIALGFGAKGDFVYLGHVARPDLAEEVLGQVRAAGGDGALLPFDVRDRAQVDQAFERVVKERGGLDVLVNNAGVARDEPFALMSEDAWTQVVSADLDGVFRCCRAAVRPMLARKRGAIVNVASVAGLRASPGQANYAAAKGGLLSLTRTLGAELGPSGIRVNAVVPGFIQAGMAQRFDRKLADAVKGHIPLGRFGEPEDVARAVLFLASDDAAYVIGHALVVDGGLSL